MPQVELDWHIRRIRQALWSYQAYSRSGTRIGRSWFEVAADIASTQADDYVIDTEIVRQFVCGTRTRPDKVRVPAEKHLAAITTFLRERGLISSDDLSRPGKDHDAIERLAHFLMQDFDSEPVAAPTGVSGTYLVFGTSGQQPSTTTLTFQHPAAGGVLMHVTESVMHFDLASVPHDPLAEDQQWWHHVARLEHSGWAIQTPEGIIMAFLKDPATGANRYLTLLGHKGNLEVEAKQLAFLVGEYPEDSELTHDLSEAVRQVLPHRVVTFAKEAAASVAAQVERERQAAGDIIERTALKGFMDVGETKKYKDRIEVPELEVRGSSYPEQAQRAFFECARTGNIRKL